MIGILIISCWLISGAFKYSDLIKKHTITAMVPFLPLQDVHVRNCITDSARRMKTEASEEMIEFVLAELDWGPRGSKLFSESGCKLVYEKVGFFLQQDPTEWHSELWVSDLIYFLYLLFLWVIGNWDAKNALPMTESTVFFDWFFEMGFVVNVWWPGVYWRIPMRSEFFYNACTSSTSI